MEGSTYFKSKKNYSKKISKVVIMTLPIIKNNYHYDI